MTLKFKFIISGTLLVISIIATLSVMFCIKREEARFIGSKITELQQLITAKQIYREVIYSKETQDFLWIPLANKEFLFAIDYTITAGVDINKGWRIENKGGKRVIILPRAEVISIDADDTSIKEFFTKQRFSKLNRDDYFELIQESKLAILSGSNVKNLLQESELNAKHLLQSILAISGLTVDIEFSDRIIEVLK